MSVIDIINRDITITIVVNAGTGPQNRGPVMLWQRWWAPRLSQAAIIFQRQSNAPSLPTCWELSPKLRACHAIVRRRLGTIGAAAMTRATREPRPYIAGNRGIDPIWMATMMGSPANSADYALG